MSRKTTTWALEQLVNPTRHFYSVVYFVENVPKDTTKEKLRFLLKKAGYEVDGFDSLTGNYFLALKRVWSSKTKKTYYGYVEQEGVEYIDYEKIS